ncbi:MAG: hypothetical protein KGI52_12055 [Burkholderiales bacterium]|nr:hypothetical protein [Burkholderiales bacterium]
MLGTFAGIVASLAALYEIYQLGKATKDLWDAKTRTGVVLTPESRLRIMAGEDKLVPGSSQLRGGLNTGGATGEWMPSPSKPPYAPVIQNHVHLDSRDISHAIVGNNNQTGTTGLNSSLLRPPPPLAWTPQ